MARVHGLQHVEGLFATHLAHHDSIRTHTQTVDHQLPLPHGTLSFDVRRPSLKPHYVFLLKLQFGGIFDSDDAVGIRNITGEHVQQRGLTSSSST